MDTTTATPTLHLTVAQAARRLGVTPSTVRRLTAAGALPSVRYGPRGRLRIDAADLAEFLDRSRRWHELTESA